MALTDHFSDAFVFEMFWRCNGIRTFDADAILFREIQCKNKNISTFKQRFQCSLD